MILSHWCILYNSQSIILTRNDEKKTKRTYKKGEGAGWNDLDVYKCELYYDMQFNLSYDLPLILSREMYFILFIYCVNQPISLYYIRIHNYNYVNGRACKIFK